jgi:PAS domain S-box-containing protein
MKEKRGEPAPSAIRPSSVRIFGLTIDRLTFRLAIGIAFLTIVPLAAGLYVLSQRQFERGIQSRRQAAEAENRILEVALRHRMIERDSSLMTAVLREVAAHPEVRDVMIVDHSGEVRIASRESRVGERFDRTSPTCLVCHAKSPEKRSRWVRFKDEQGEVLRTVQPIENRPECHSCHDPRSRFNGMLLLDTSLVPLQAEMDRDLAGIAVGAGLVAFLLVAGLGFIVRTLILKRLVRFGRAARSIAAGNFNERVPTEGDDVITSLAKDFNEMVRSVSELIAEVQHQEAQLSSVMNSLDDGLVVLDRDARVVACNTSFSRRVNVSPEKIQASRCHEIVWGSLPCCGPDREGHECPVSRCVATGQVQRTIFRVPGPAGELARVEEVYASPVIDRKGEVVQVVELWRDITARVKEEEHLAEIERLVSLGVLASGFSHEVNTPLASMLTCAESVIARIDDAARGGPSRNLLPSVREAATIICDQVLRCRQTTEQFLRFSRGIPPTIEPLDLGRRVEEVVALATPTARENGVTVEFVPRGDIPLIRANAEVVKHVVLNLLVNAIQSCAPKGGRVVVGIDVNGDVRILVRDTGCGIHRDDRRHLFEPFRSRKPQGTGLGLFLSRTFVRRFGGDVRLVESEVGVGSCFEIVFRRVEETVQ